MLEYVSKYNKRKDYEDNMRKYESKLKVPYYLLFYPDAVEMSLYQLRGRKYRSVKANANGRFALAELDVEVALLDDWVRYWYKGELLPLPADLQRDLDETRQQLRKMTRRAATAEDEVQRLRAELERIRGAS